MPSILTISTTASDITGLKTDYAAKEHDVPTPTVNEATGEVKIENVPTPNGDTSQMITDIIMPISDVLLKMQSDLKAIKTEIDSMVDTFKTHMHPTGTGPSGPPSTPMT
jgi:hypothetical protein